MGDFSSDIGQLILRLRQEYLSNLQREIDRNGIKEVTPTIIRLLIPLNNEGTVTVNQLASLAGLDNSTTTLLLNRMENESLIEKNVDDKDRRIVWITLSEKGESLIDKVKKAVDEVSNKALSGVTSAEQATIKRGLYKLLTNLSG